MVYLTISILDKNNYLSYYPSINTRLDKLKVEDKSYKKDMKKEIIKKESKMKNDFTYYLDVYNVFDLYKGNPQIYRYMKKLRGVKKYIFAGLAIFKLLFWCFLFIFCFAPLITFGMLIFAYIFLSIYLLIFALLLYILKAIPTLMI